MADWVVQPQDTWQSINLSGATYVDPLPTNSVGFYPLTAWTAESGEAANEYRLPQKSMTRKAVQVRGHIHGNFWHAENGSWGNIWNLPWRILVSYRITVIPQETNGRTPAPLPDYDLQSATSANDEFVWERSRLHVNIPTDDWAGTPAMRANIDWTIPVVAKTTRVLRPGECLALVMQQESSEDVLGANVYNQIDGLIEVHHTVRLRTYVI